MGFVFIMTPMNLFYCDHDHDDIEFFASVVERINSNITISIANTSKDALALLKETNIKPDFLFFDHNMPVLDGLGCATAIKSYNGLSKIPFIVISSQLQSALTEAYNILGVDTFIVKTNLTNLEQALRGVLNQQ